MLDELWARPESGPFQYPVDTKEVPFYKKVIKKPMDLNQIRMNVENNKLVLYSYLNFESTFFGSVAEKGGMG